MAVDSGRWTVNSKQWTVGSGQQVDYPLTANCLLPTAYCLLNQMRSRILIYDGDCGF
jgi:hypothetical protein